MRVFVALLLLVLSLSMSFAQEEEPPWAGMQQQLIPTGIPTTGLFHRTRQVALSGDTAFVSAPWANHSGNYFVGLITVFKLIEGNWVQQETIFPPEPALWDYLYFGSLMSADGNYLTVQAAQKCIQSTVFPYHCISPGKAIYIYTRSGDEWVFDTKITEVPDISGQHVRLDGGFVDGETVVIEGSRVMRDELDDAEGDVFLYKRIDGVWTVTDIVSNDPDDTHKFFHAAGLSQDGNTLLMRNPNWLHVFHRTEAGWEFSARIDAPRIEWRRSIAALNDRGDTIAVMWSWYNPDGDPQYALYIYRLNGSVWEIIYTTPKLWQEPYKMAFDGETLAVGSGYRRYEDSRSVARIYKEIDGQWKQYSILPIYRTPIPGEVLIGEAMLMAFDGEHLLSDIHVYDEGGDGSSVIEIWALKIPGVEQDVPQTIGLQSAPNVLALPDGPLAYRNAAPSDFSVFHVALKTRPTKTVKLRLTTNGNVLLDVGGVASPVLTLKFTRDNWNIPQEVRARLSPSQSGALSAIVREEIVGTSAHEYKLIKAAKVRVNVPPTAFMQDTPAQASALPDGTPVTFTWRPYSLATRYVVKLKRTSSTRQFKYPVDPATACTIDLCTLTLDRTALPKGSAFKWRVVAQDQPAAFQRVTTWRKFTLIAPQ